MQRIVVVAVSFLMVMALVAMGVPGIVMAQQNPPTLPPTNTPRGTMPATATEVPPTITPEPTATASPTLTLTSTLSAIYTPSPTATLTQTPSETPIPTEEPNGIPPRPTLYYPLNPDTSVPNAAVTAIPTAMPRLAGTIRDENDEPYDIVNIVLIGHDSQSLQIDNVFRTDTMIVVSINLDTDTVSMLALPRDLMVWVPGWTMQRLNLAWGWGDAVGWTDGGWGLFRQTVLYNFGIDLHYYAMVDFSGFKTIIDTLGGVTIVVDCPIAGPMWTGEYDEAGTPTFEETLLPVGVHELDSIQALWYARTRKDSTDFDRGRRQQQVLRAIFSKGRDLGLITELPTLWEQMNEVVETNVPLSMMVELAPIALSIQPNEIENHFFRLNTHSRSWTTPDGSGVQLPNGAMITLIMDFFNPPTNNRLVTDAPLIAIYDASGQGAHWDQVAADRLLWEGLLSQPSGEADEIAEHTYIVDYTGEEKGSSIAELKRVLNVREENILDEPDPNSEVEYAVFLGSDYTSCFEREVTTPIEPTVTPTAEN